MHSSFANNRGFGSVGLAKIVACLLFAACFCFGMGQVQSEPYKLGPEDVISVAVRNHIEFSGDFVIPADGIVDLPLAGTTKIDGKTLAQVREIIFGYLRKRLVTPEINVVLKMPRIRRVFVEGAVRASVPIDYKPGFRISEVLAGAGGLPDAVQPIDCKVTLLHAGTNKVDEVALSDVYAGKKSANLPVQPGDVVTVITLESIPVYVVGQVKVPGVIRMRTDQVTLMASIAMAGGLLPTASTSGVTITHSNGQVQKVDITGVVLNGEKAKLPTLKSGDLISVPELQSRFAVTGLVKVPGLFPLPDGKSYRLSDAIALAGGWDTKRARMSRIALLRNDHGKMKRIVINYGLFLTKGDATQNVELQAGDVLYIPETNSIDWGVILQAVSASYYIVNANNLLKQ